MSLDSKYTSQSHGKMEDVNLNVSVNSIYNLITKLCEKLLSNQKSSPSNKLIRKYRSKAYEIFLSKKVFEQGLCIWNLKVNCLIMLEYLSGCNYIGR